MSEDRDPNGLDAHTPGAKLDMGKNRLGLVLSGFAKALQDVGRVGTYGASKYTPEGWKYVEGGRERYWDALWRHLFAHAGGERLDSESCMPHLAHAAWNILAIIELGPGGYDPEFMKFAADAKQVTRCRMGWKFLLGKISLIWRWLI